MPVLLFLIAVVVVIYLYFMLIGWLFAVVAPEFLLLGSVLGTAVVPVIYGLVVYRVLDTPAPRRALWVPVFALLTLIYFDLALIVLKVLAGNMSAHVARPLFEVLRAVVNLPGNRAGVGIWTHVFGAVPVWWVYVLIGTTVKGVLVVALLLLIRGFQSEVLDKKQPAYRQYFFGQARIDLRAVAEETVRRLYDLVVLAAQWIMKMSTGPQAWFVWPLTITAYIALVPPVIAAAVSLAILLSIHFIGIAVASAIAMYVSAMLFCMERAIMLARSGYAKCPHAGCHQPVPLPIFYCGECGVAHTRLIPGPCGVFHRTCSCGKARLPTTFWLGKARGRSACARCTKPLRRELFGGSAHVPIYGAPSSGKTMLMMGATWQLVQGRLADVHADFINETDRASYDTSWRPGFESGRVREKTHQMLPDAFLLSVRRSTGLPVSLYMYDPAGEAIERESDIEGHRFLQYFDGLALLIDPFSLPSFARICKDGGNGALPPSTSQADPMDVVHRVVNVLESKADLVRGRDFARRVAVIITKADNEIVQRELGISLEDPGPGARWQDAGLDDDRRVRAWLQTNEPGLLQILETRFAKLRFFVVSALGHEPGARTAFQPRKLLDPLCWLLSARTTLTRPRLARFAGRAAEVASAVAVFAIFVVPGFVAARIALHAAGVVR